MTKYETGQALKKEAELKQRLRENLDTPSFDRLWRSLGRRGHVDQVLGSSGAYTFEDLVADSELIAEDQRDEKRDGGYVGSSPGPARGSAHKTYAEETDLSPYEYERAQAESVIHAVEAASRQDVKDYRAARKDAKGRPYPSREDLQRGKKLWTKARVSRLCKSLARGLPWTEEQAKAFLECGEYPILSPLSGTIERGSDTKITITAEPYVSADSIRRFYLHMQSHTSGKARQATPKSVAVFRFVLEQVLERGERPRWGELQKLWNRAYPAQAFKSRGGLKKAYLRADESISKPLPQNGSNAAAIDNNTQKHRATR